MDLTDIDDWNTGALDSLVSELTRKFTSITEANRMLTTIGTSPGWLGNGATAAKESFTSVSSSMNDEAAALGAAAELARQTSAAVKELQATLATLRKDASGVQMAVEPPPSVTDLAKDVAPADRGARAAIKQQLLTRAKALVTQAEDIDDDTAAVLQKINNGEIPYPQFGSLDEAFNAGRAGGRLTAPFWPGMDTKTPEEINAWWRALPAEQKQQMVNEHPEIIGNLNGVDSASRDFANRAMLSAEIGKLKTEIADLDDKYRNAPGYYALPQVNQKKAQLVNLEKLDRTLRAEYDLKAGADTRAYLLAFETGDEGQKAAVAVGNPDTARYVNVTVPGVNTDVGSIESMAREADGLRRETSTILNSSDRGDEQVSTIAWIGYETPKVGIAEPAWEAITDTKAKEGSQDLALFTTSLGLTSQYTADEQHLMLSGHSYGSTTASLALQTGSAPYVDDAVFYGSPGLYANSTSAFGLERGHAYLMNDPDDVWINRAANEGFHGSNPFNSDIIQLSTEERTTEDGVHREGVDRHSEYTRAQEDTGKPGTRENPLRISGYNLAAILAGRPDLVHETS